MLKDLTKFRTEVTRIGKAKDALSAAAEVIIFLFQDHNIQEDKEEIVQRLDMGAAKVLLQSHGFNASEKELHFIAHAIIESYTHYKGLSPCVAWDVAHVIDHIDRA